MIVVNGTDPNVAQLRAELERLRIVRQQLSTQLLEAADQLETPGVPPSASLIDDLLACRHHMQRLGDLLGLRVEAGDDSISLDQLQIVIEARDCRQSALALKQQLAELTHVDVPDFAPLLLCKREASRLCELAAQSNATEKDADLEALRQYRHPLNSLMRLCDGEQLSDAEWTVCNDEVVAAYGRQIATALTRGRIRRLSVLKTADSTREAITQASSSSADANVESKATEPIFEAPVDSVFDLAPASAGPGTRPIAVRTSVTQEQSVKQTVPVSPVPTPATRSTTNDLILRLLKDGRLPLALQLTRCLEQRQRTQAGLPPAWVVRALILGRHLSYSKGEIARQLEEELRQFRPEQVAEGTVEGQQAMSMLLRAAALPAALLAGSTSAATILRAFKIAPGSSQLYNYCSRITMHGDRLSDRLAEMFQPGEKAAVTAELNELRNNAQDWLQQAAKNAVGYKRNSPLFLHAHWTLTAGTAIQHLEATSEWCKWQETLSLAWRLLQPICNRAEGERNWVRQEIARLSTRVRVESQDQTSRAAAASSSPGKVIVLPSEKMHSVLLEAVAIANRWLLLNQQAASRNGSPLPMEALDLRDEIMQRTDAVLSELSQHRQSTSLFVQAAIACCQRTIRHIHAMFEAKRSLPLVEPDPRHALNADLLRISGIELNDQWLPETELSEVEGELIAAAEQSERSWRQSFDDHAQNGNHEATGRLLELNVWNEAERESLRVIRQLQIDENRAVLNVELQEIATELSLGESPLHRRLHRLLQDLPKVTNFAAFRRQLAQFHAAVVRQRMKPSPVAVSRTTTCRDAEPWEQTPAGPYDRVVQSCDIFSGE